MLSQVGSGGSRRLVPDKLQGLLLGIPHASFEGSLCRWDCQFDNSKCSHHVFKVDLVSFWFPSVNVQS